EFVSNGFGEEPELCEMAPVFDIVEAPGGKPLVVDEKGEPYPVHVSVTHTGNWWICAVGEYPMGIDAELKERRVNPVLIRRICTEEEQQWLESGAADIDESKKEEWLRQKLLWLWVRKEAYVKYLGTGIGEGLKSFSVVDINENGEWDQKPGFQTVDVMEELELAVYSPEDEVEEIRWRKW
ncbi:MAG: 4-phosphopantetheinyl transferase family protein, partial [Firmicutes bacterium]|nr:4-phosphopantetheinyl transferase family protein [Bacillota bacterium]